MKKYDVREKIQKLNDHAQELNYGSEYVKEGEVRDLALLWSIVYAIIDKLPEDHAQEILDKAEEESAYAEDSAKNRWRNR